MNSTRHILAHVFLFAFALALGGCFDSTGGGDAGVDVTSDIQSDTFLPRLTCAALLPGGCCNEADQIVTNDESCPPGRSPIDLCPSDCDPCDGEPRQLCYDDLGDGCCGSAVMVCGECPSGRLPQTSCTERFPSCGCGPEYPMGGLTPPDDGERPADPDADPVPPAPADAGPPAFDAAEPLVTCVEHFGGGCCGDYVQDQNACGCPIGTIEDYLCVDYPERDALPPAIICRADFGGGCCGGEVPLNFCTGECPEGSVDATTCGAVTESSTDAPGIIAPSSCFAVSESGCCADPVMADACGQCPDGSVPSDMCIVHC